MLHHEFEDLGNIFNYTDLYTQIAVGNLIDKELQKFNPNDGDTKYIAALQQLLDYTDKLSDSEARALLPWFYPQRSILFMHLFANEEIREENFKIIKSGKIPVLAQMAEPDLQEEDLRFVLHNAEEVKKYIAWKNQSAENKASPDEEIGLIGEQIVYSDLLKIFVGEDFEVIWASKQQNEARFDFEVRKNNEVVCYVDAKTTNQGSGNRGSVPFFVRKAQWDFLKSEDLKAKYFIARVFLGEEAPVEYLEIASNSLQL